VWLLGVWERSPRGEQIAREIFREYPPEQVGASPYAVRSFTVEPSFGDEEGLRFIREALRERGLRLVLDFIPNHLAVDHPWTIEHPERFVPGSDGQPFAHGKDPFFPPWTDTLQLDYRRADVREAMTGELLRISERCDGVRCDMAMLVLRDVFRGTWGGDFDPPDAEFWPAAIEAVRRRRSDFLFLAEAYWGLGGVLRSMGFDATYDKDLYDRLRHDGAPAVREHLRAPRDVHDHFARFVENHDEDRAAAAFVPPAKHRAAATVTLALPGLRLVHDGQLEGRSLRIPIQLRTRPDEPPDPALQRFYAQLLPALRHPVFSEGEWRLLEPRQAWDGNPSHQNFVAFAWVLGEEMRLVAVNLAGTPSQCYLPLDVPRLAGKQWYLSDVLNDHEYRRDGDELLSRGLYLNVPGFFSHLFVVQEQARGEPARTLDFLEERGVLRGDGNPLDGLAWSPDGRTLAYGGTADVWLSDGRRLTGHQDAVGCLAWSPDERTLASGSDDRTVRLWAVAGGTGRVLYTHHDHVVTVAFSPDGKWLASGGVDRTVALHDLTAGTSEVLTVRNDAVNAIVWSPDGTRLACGAGDQSVVVFDVAARRQTLELRGSEWIGSLAWSPDGAMLAAGTGAGTVDVWDAHTGQHVRICEGHTERVLAIAFSADGSVLVSKAADGTVRFRDARTWETRGTLEERGIYLGGLAFGDLLATRDDAENAVRLWRVDLAGVLRSTPVVATSWYKNAKVVLVGESGVGKSALALRLVKDVFEKTSSTGGAWVTQLPLPVTGLAEEIEAEIWLWDFAGQPDYRLVHQLFMDETALAILVFDPQKERPFEGLAQWDHDVEAAAGHGIAKLLVAGRVDVGRELRSLDDIEAFMKKRGYVEYVATSAFTGEGIDALRQAIARHIPWDAIPSTVSPRIFRLLKGAIIRLKDENRVLVRTADLKRELELRLGESFTMDQLRVVIGLLSGPGIVRRLEFGDFVLLQPERINAYAGAVIRAVRAHPEEIGCITEERLVGGQLDYGGMERLPPDEEAIVLRAMYEALLQRGICLRENAEGGTFLIFPSYYRRERRRLEGDLPPIVTYRFEGPLDEIYSTLIVRLYHSAAFEQGSLWRYAAEFHTLGGKKRIRLKMTRQDEEGVGELSVDAERWISDEMVATFIGYVHEHLERKAQHVERNRHFVCLSCSAPVADHHVVRRLLEAGRRETVCQSCGERVPLWDLVEELFASDAVRRKVQDLDERARAARLSESRELNLASNVYAIVSSAGQIYRSTNSDQGEIEFRDDQGNATGERLSLLLKAGGTAASQHAVMLVVSTPGGIRWMDVHDADSDGEPFTPDAVLEYRQRLLSGE
jgi:small GTP-binding protein